jgi:hypothetical protein
MLVCEKVGSKLLNMSFSFQVSCCTQAVLIYLPSAHCGDLAATVQDLIIVGIQR